MKEIIKFSVLVGLCIVLIVYQDRYLLINIAHDIFNTLGLIGLYLVVYDEN